MSPDSIEIVPTIRIWTRISIPNSISIDLYQKLVDFVVIFDINSLLIDFYDLLIDCYDLLINLFDLYINLLIKMDWFYIEIAIVDSISSLDFELDQNWRSNSDTNFDSTMTIRFATPNGISLVPVRFFDVFIWIQQILARAINMELKWAEYANKVGSQSLNNL